MKSFNEPWIKTFSRENGWQISTKAGWSFAGTYGQENDPYGELTAQRICDYHNLVVPALRAVWADIENLGWVSPVAHQMVKNAIEATGGDECKP
jgi:hypothetical protein